jgi:hypothetical protein
VPETPTEESVLEPAAPVRRQQEPQAVRQPERQLVPWPQPELIVGVHRAQPVQRRPSGEDPRPARGGKQTCNSFGVKLLGSFLYHLPPNRRYPRPSDPSSCIYRLIVHPRKLSQTDNLPQFHNQTESRLIELPKISMNHFFHENQQAQEGCQNFTNYMDRREQGQT